MADQTTRSDVIRKGATRAELYNEGLLVYLYDSKNRQAIMKQNGHKLVDMPIARTPEQKKLVVEQEKKLAQFSRSAMLVAYELQQDDSLVTDVIVGEPLTIPEMKPVRGVRWHKPQRSRLSLPSGELRIETPNSCRIARDEEPQELGATIKVPKGEYTLTLYRIDYDETSDTAREEYQKYKGPQEVIVLTPASRAKAPHATSALLPFPIKREKLTWVGKYSISSQSGSCMVNFVDYWEFFRLNLDRGAFTQAKIEPGSLLEISAVGKKFNLVYLEGLEFNLGHLGAYQSLFGNERMTASIRSLPEVSFGGFQKVDDAGTEILFCMRIKATDAVDRKHHGKWRKATMQLPPQKLEFADRASFGKWRREQDSLHGEVLFRTPYYVSMNFDASALQSLGAKAGDILRLRIGGQSATLRLLENAKQFLEADKAQKSEGEEQWEALKDRYTFAADEQEKEKVRQEMRTFLLDEIPLVGYLDSHWLHREQKIFLAHPSAVESGFFKFQFTHGLPVDLGASVILEKISSAEAASGAVLSG